MATKAISRRGVKRGGETAEGRGIGCGLRCWRPPGRGWWLWWRGSWRGLFLGHVGGFCHVCMLLGMEEEETFQFM
jgi:hypothetical protein